MYKILQLHCTTTFHYLFHKFYILLLGHFRHFRLSQHGLSDLGTSLDLKEVDIYFILVLFCSKLLDLLFNYIV